jgi:WD40 repeat protein
VQVAWHPAQPDLLVSTSVDGSVVAFRTDGTKTKVLRHPAAVSGCAWHPSAAMQLATTSETGSVYVWDLSQPGDNCLIQTLTGHAKRSFRSGSAQLNSRCYSDLLMVVHALRPALLLHLHEIQCNEMPLFALL